MKEITLKELSTYLPYGLKLWYEDNKDIYPLVVSNNTVSIRGGFNINDVKSYNLKPILYDLSWLTREITHEGETFIPIDKIHIYENNSDYLIEMIITGLVEKIIWEMLVSWKFNIFNLPDELIVRVTEDFNPYK